MRVCVPMACRCSCDVENEGNFSLMRICTCTYTCTLSIVRMWLQWVVVWVFVFLFIGNTTCACVLWMFLFCSTLNCTRIGRHHFQRLLCESGTNTIFCGFASFKNFNTRKKIVVFTRVIVSIIIIAVEALATAFNFHSSIWCAFLTTHWARFLQHLVCSAELQSVRT